MYVCRLKRRKVLETYGNVGGSKPLEFYKLISDR